MPTYAPGSGPDWVPLFYVDRLHRAYPSLHPFGVVHWVPVLSNIKTATGCESGGAPSWITENACKHILLLWGRRLWAHSGRAKRVENGVYAIQKWVPFTPKCSQKRWRLGLRTRPLNYSEGERFWRLPVWHAKLKMVLTLFKNGSHSHPNAPKSVDGWGSAKDPPIARESALPVWLAEMEGAPLPIFAPGAINPRYIWFWLKMRKHASYWRTRKFCVTYLLTYLLLNG